VKTALPSFVVAFSLLNGRIGECLCGRKESLGLNLDCACIFGCWDKVTEDSRATDLRGCTKKKKGKWAKGSERQTKVERAGSKHDRIARLKVCISCCSGSSAAKKNKSTIQSNNNSGTTHFFPLCFFPISYLSGNAYLLYIHKVRALFLINLLVEKSTRVSNSRAICPRLWVPDLAFGAPI